MSGDKVWGSRMCEQCIQSREHRAQSREHRAESRERRVLISLLSTLCSLLIISCNPWYFALQQHTGWEIEGKIYDHKERVEVVNRNTVLVEAPAKIAMRCFQITDGVFDTEVTLFNRGTYAADDEVIFHCRSTPYADTVLSRTDGDLYPSYFAVVVSNDYAVVYHQDTSYAWHGIIPEPGTPFRLRVVQHGHYADVEVACTDLGQYRMDDATTQWISVAPQGEQRVEIRDPIFRPLRDEFPPVADADTFVNPFLR